MGIMSLFRRNLAYMRDNPEHLWFKRKLYGWGWVPVRWQGWVAVLLFMGIMLVNALRLPADTEPSSGELIPFFSVLIISATVLMIICYKTGERPRWQWGPPKSDKHTD